MSVFDYIRCEYPLPSHPQMQDREFQTRSIGFPFMRHYVLTADGRLEHRPEPNEWQETIDVSVFRGEVRFEDWEFDPGPGPYGPDRPYPRPITFSALFDEGRLINIKELIFAPYEPAQEEEEE